MTYVGNDIGLCVHIYKQQMNKLNLGRILTLHEFYFYGCV